MAVPSFGSGAWNATSGTLFRSSVSKGPPEGALFGGVGNKSFRGVFGSIVKLNCGTERNPSAGVICDCLPDPVMITCGNFGSGFASPGPDGRGATLSLPGSL